MYRNTELLCGLKVRGITANLKSKNERRNVLYSRNGERGFYFRDGIVYSEKEYNEMYPVIPLKKYAPKGDNPDKTHI